MRVMRITGMVLFTGMLVAGAVQFDIAKDRMAVVDGQRTFILGLYENPESDEVLASVAEAGFNLVYATGNVESLDRLHEHGLWAWINTGARIDLQEDAEARTAQLREMVAAYGNHPAMLVWEVPDEALWNCWYFATMWRRNEEPTAQRARIDALEDKAAAEVLRAKVDEARGLHAMGEHARAEQLADEIWEALGEASPRPGLNLSNAAERADAMSKGMRAGYALLRSLDPPHPVWMNHAPRNQIDQLAAFNKAADIAGCDIYPVPRSEHQGHSDVALTTVASVGAYTQRMQEAAPGKPVWMVLQGFGWSDLSPERDPEMRRPTMDETRFMAYDTIVRGARGILYWGSAYIEKDSGLWTDLLALAREIKELQPVLSAPDTKLKLKTTFEETWGSVDRKVEVLGKQVDGKVWLIVVNEWPEPLRYTVHGLRGLNGQRYRVRGSEDEAVVDHGTLTLLLRGHGVQVLEPVGE